MIAAEELQSWGKDQLLGIFVVLVVIALCIPSMRRTGVMLGVLGFVALVALETAAPGTVTQ